MPTRVYFALCGDMAPESETDLVDEEEGGTRSAVQQRAAHTREYLLLACAAHTYLCRYTPSCSPSLSLTLEPDTLTAAPLRDARCFPLGDGSLELRLPAVVARLLVGRGAVGQPPARNASTRCTRS